MFLIKKVKQLLFQKVDSLFLNKKKLFNFSNKSFTYLAGVSSLVSKKCKNGPNFKNMILEGEIKNDYTCS